MHGRIQLNFCGVGRRASCVKLRLKPTINVAGSRVPIPPAPLLRRGVGGGTRALFRHLAGWGHLGGKSVLSSPFLEGFRGSETRLQPLFRHGFSLFIDTNGILQAPKIQVKCTTACLGIGNWRSAIGHYYYYASF